MKKLLFIAALFLLQSFTLAYANRAYIKIVGTKQGVFMGDDTKPNMTLIKGFTFGGSNSKPTPSGTTVGGKKILNPVTITKEFGSCSPQLYAAFSTNELLKNVTIELYRPNDIGEYYLERTITLTNATIINIEDVYDEYQGNLNRESVTFAFQRIRIVHAKSGTVFEDGVTTPEKPLPSPKSSLE